MRFLAALLAATLPLLANGEAQLLPFGKFAARDGRPGPGQHWELNDAGGAALAVQLNALVAKTPLVIDYEHQTLRSETNGKEAPAAGWITSVEWRAGAGLFAAVDWTDQAKAYIAAKQYRYISPVILFDKSGTVTGLYNAALVGTPALLGMEPVMAELSAQLSTPTNDPQEPDMALLASLLAAIGLAADTTEAKALEHVAALTATAAAAKTKVDAPVALFAALSLKPEATEAEALAAVAALKTPGVDPATLALITGLQSQVAALSTAATDRTLTELVDGAISANKFPPAQRDALMAIGKKDIASLQSLTATAVAIPGLNGQSGGKGLGEPGTAALSAQAALVMQQFGLTTEEFAKAAPKAA